MKKLLLMLSTALMLTFTGCMQFDDTRIWDAIDELEDLYDNLDGRLEKLEEECEKMNTNIEALQTLVSALQAQDTITTIAPIKQGDEIIGYTISFSKSEPITIYHGEDGKDGADGEDGITPKLEIRDGYWYISYDNGQSWVELGKATGEDGKDGANGVDGADGEDGKDGENGKDGADGDSLFESVTWDEEYAYFTLSDGTVITIPLSDGAVTKTVEVNAVEMIGLCADNLCMFVLTDSGFNHEAEYWGDAGWMSFNSEYYVVGLVLETIDDSSVVPQGTFTSESGEIDIRDGSFYQYLGDDWDDSYDYNFDNAVVIVSEDKIEATFTLENGEVHHVIYEGSLELYFKGITDKEEDNEDGDLPPANEIWYTSTDGEVVTPFWEIDEEGNSVFNANIISNTYENGKGVITFDSDVTSIGYGAFAMRTNLKSIIIPNSVTVIGDCALAYNETLTSVILPESLTFIGEDAFCGCSSLETITIPNSVVEIERYAFDECISLPIEDNVRYADTYAVEVIDDTLTTYSLKEGTRLVNEGLFSFCENLTSVILPESLTCIGKEMFSNCSNLENVVIPNSVTAIKNNAFSWCVNLTNITIPEGVTHIGDRAFSNCKSLTKIYIPESVTFIGGGVFNYCENLAEIKGKYASQDNRALVIDGAFVSFARAGLTKYNIPEGVTIIEDDVFQGCSNLTNIAIPNSVTSIGEYAFADCKSLASVTIPNSVTSIGNNAFEDCSSLASVSIGNGVTSIEYYAFADCKSLAEVYCKPTTPPTGGPDMFAYLDENWNIKPIGCTIYVPTESVDEYKAADYWSDYADYIKPYNFGGGEGNAGVKEVAAVSLVGFYCMTMSNFYYISGYVSSGEDAGYDLPMNSWNYGFSIISDTEPVNDEIPLGTYTYVDYEKLESGEEELKTGIFTIAADWGLWCAYVDANGEMQEYKYTEGTMVVSEGKIELTVTLDNGEVHHVVYEGSLQTWGEVA